jgi:ABC-type nitrate/sulfonate/bicarbonate transport system substrate-binding protein
MMQSLQVTVFPGGTNLPLWTAMTKGFFAAQGLEINVHYTRNSVEQITALVHGDCDLGLTGFDNIVAYQEGQGEAELDRAPDLFAFMGGDDAFLHLVVRSDINSYADLRGKILSVDALTTGFAFVLRKMLGLNGIAEGDVTFERAGGALQRFEALKEGRQAGTLLLTPFEISGRKFGLKVLQSARDVLPHYQGLVGVASRSWAQRNNNSLVRFIIGYLLALDWLFGPQNRAEAATILARHVPGMPPEAAAATCEIYLTDVDGFDPAARLDIEGMRTVLALRSEYGRPQKMLADFEKYVDLSYYDRALANTRSKSSI